MDKLLITGHKGYIGSNLWDFLEDDFELYGLDFPDDILQIDSFPDVDAVIHLASFAGVRRSIKEPHRYFENNVGIASTIFDNYAHVPILSASSSSVKELKSPYSMSKYAIEQMNKSVIHMRFHTVWGGKGYRPDMLFGLAKEDKLTFITDQKRDYTRVEDVCSAIVVMLNNYWKLEGHAVDVGYGKPKSNVDFLKEIGYTKKLPIIQKIEGVPESDSTCANSDLLRALGWKPKYE